MCIELMLHDVRIDVTYSASLESSQQHLENGSGFKKTTTSPSYLLVIVLDIVPILVDHHPDDWEDTTPQTYPPPLKIPKTTKLSFRKSCAAAAQTFHNKSQKSSVREDQASMNRL